MILRVPWALALMAVLAAAAPAQASERAFTAALSGDQPSTRTGSKATGAAKIVVDTEAQTVGLSLDVEGLTIQDLWSNLLNAPMGPIHLHLYGGHDHSDPDSAALLFPAPYGPAYAATPTGFRVRMVAFPYATGARLVNGTASFGEFVAYLESGRVVLNVHTNAHADGEISGEVVPAQGAAS